MTYSPEEIENFFSNGFEIASQTSGTSQDEGWPVCLACALIDRQMSRNGTPRTTQCQECFKNYCGGVNLSKPI